MITNTGNYRITLTETVIYPPEDVLEGRKAAIVIDSEIGPDYPYLIKNESELLEIYGEPIDRIGILEVLPLVNKNYNVYVCRAISNDSLYGGFDVFQDRIESFGKRSGRPNLNYLNIRRNPIKLVGISNGIQTAYSGNFDNTGSNDIYVQNSAKLYINDNEIQLTPTGPTSYTFGTLNSTLNIANNLSGPIDYTITFNGTPGTPAQLVGNIDLTTLSYPYTLSNTLSMNLFIDDIVLIDFRTNNNVVCNNEIDIVNALNSAFQAITNTSLTPFSLNSLNNLVITGFIGDSNSGRVKITNPSTLSYSSMVNEFFDSTLTQMNQTVNSTSPTGDIPLYNQKIVLDIIYDEGDTSDISHSFFTFSKYDYERFPLKAKVEYLGQKRFKLYLYKSEGNNLIELGSWLYSLDPNDKDDFGFSIYIYDVFNENKYVKPLVNQNYNNNYTFTISNVVPLEGGFKGSPITPNDVKNAFNKFNDLKYKNIVLFIDTYGNNINEIDNLIKNYHYYAFCISMVPKNLSINDAILYVKSLKELDNFSIYFNRLKIINPYTLNYVYVSGLGDLATRYLEQEPLYDGFPPAYIDKSNGTGGQLRFYNVIDLEYTLTEEQKELLDKNKINPFIILEGFGLLAYGDRTLHSKTYIHERRVSNFIIKDLVQKILVKYIGALNTRETRQAIATECLMYLLQIEAINAIENPQVICDESNNKEQLKRGGRELVVDVYINIPPSIQRIHIRFTRTSGTILVES